MGMEFENQKYGVKCADVWYKEVPDEVFFKGCWRMGMRRSGTDWIEVLRQHRRLNIIVQTVVDRTSPQWTFLDF